MRVSVEFYCPSDRLDRARLVHEVGQAMTQATGKVRNLLDDNAGVVALTDTEGNVIGTVRVAKEPA